MQAPDYNDVWSGAWDDMRRYGPMARHSHRLMATMTRDLAPASILDVGCGEGSLLRALSHQHSAACLAGFEFAENAVRLARQRLPTAEFHIGDITQDALAQTFDLVVCADVVEHLDDDEAALKQMARMVSPGGRLIVATLRGRQRAVEAHVGHVRNYAEGELQDKLTRTGLTIERVTAWGFPFFSPLYRDVLDLLGNRGTTGRYGLVRKCVCHILYALFRINSATRGDYIFVRARKPLAVASQSS